MPRKNVNIDRAGRISTTSSIETHTPSCSLGAAFVWRSRDAGERRERERGRPLGGSAPAGSGGGLLGGW